MSSVQELLVKTSANAAAITRVRSAVAALAGSDGLTLSEGLGRLVVTTSDDLRTKGPGYFQMAPNVLAPTGLGLPALMDEQRAAISRTRAAIGPTGNAEILRHTSGSDEWALVLPDTEKADHWRVQFFDPQGFGGRASFAGRDHAVAMAQARGFLVPDDSALDRVQDSPQFKRGLLVDDLSRRLQVGTLRREEASNLLAHYDGQVKVLHSVASGRSQAFVASGGSIMYLLADRIPEGAEQSVVMHELVHRYGKPVLGDRGFGSLVARLKAWAGRPADSTERVIHDAAHRRAIRAAGSDQALFDEELFAYGVEEAIARGVRPRASAHPDSADAWLEQVSATFRAVIQGVIGSQAVPEAVLGAQELVDLAYAFAQLESPARVDLILGRLSSREQQIVNGWLGRQGAPAWYSELEQRVRTHGQSRMPPEQWSSWLNAQTKSGVKPDEIHWSGVEDWLSAMPAGKSVPREDVLAFLGGNGVQVRDIVRQGRPSRDLAVQGVSTSVRYGDYTLPGGENYREVLLTLPGGKEIGSYGQWLSKRMGITDLEAEDTAEYDDDVLHDQFMAEEARTKNTFHSDHWQEPNVLAHLRLNDRTDVDGSKVLFVEEVQSDWGQVGKKKGFVQTRSLRADELAAVPGPRAFSWLVYPKSTSASEAMDVGVVIDAGTSAHAMLEVLYGDLYRMATINGKRAVIPVESFGVPVAPFVQTTPGWLSLALKRVVMLAVEGGYEQVAFLNGEQSASRYDLSRSISRVDYERANDGKFEVRALDKKGALVFEEDELTIERVAELLGKDLAKKIAAGVGEPANPGGWGVFDGEVMLFESRFYETAKEFARVAEGAPTIRRLSDGYRDWRVLEEGDLKVGGEGMKAFYDTILPGVLKPLLKKLGGDQLVPVELDQASFETPQGAGDDELLAELGVLVKGARPDTQLGFRVTPAMRQAVNRGVPLFSQQDVSAPVKPFDLWFHGSAVVAEDGAPLIVYRGEGSGEERNTYSLGDTRESGIFMTPDKSIAQIYEQGGREPRAFYVRAESLIDLTKDTRGNRQFVAEWASNFDEWIDRGSGEAVDPFDCLMGGQLFNYEGDWSGSRWKSLQSEVLASYDAAYLPDWDNAQGVFKALIVGNRASIKSATHNSGQFDLANPDIRYSFAGPVAATADQSALATAQQRMAAGEDAELVRRETGWHRGPDEKWRFEISDEHAKLKDRKQWGQSSDTRQVRLGDVLEHPQLFAAYPSLGDLVFTLDQNMPAREGCYTISTKTICLSGKSDDVGLLSDLLHEVQHAIQRLEGFATGGSPRAGFADVQRGYESIDDVNAQLAYIVNQKDLAKASGHAEKVAELSALYDSVMDYKLTKLVPQVLRDPMDEYRRLAGETEARNTQARQSLTSEQRLATPPSATADVPEADLIVRFDSSAQRPRPG